MDVNVKITVQIGQVRMPIAEILNIQPGQTVALSGKHDEPLKIFVNDKLFAFGEAVQVDGKYAVRILEIAGKEKVTDVEPTDTQPDDAKRSA